MGGSKRLSAGFGLWALGFRRVSEAVPRVLQEIERERERERV